MAEFARPTPDLVKIAQAWNGWVGRADDGETLPGRTMADLKVAGTDKVIETVATDNPDHPEIGQVAEVWDGWERGRTGPTESLAALAAAGFGRIVEGLSVE